MCRGLNRPRQAEQCNSMISYYHSFCNCILGHISFYKFHLGNTVWCAHVLMCIHAQHSATSWTVAHQTPLTMGFSRQEYWTGLPFLPPGNLLDPWMKPLSLVSPELTSGFCTIEPPRKPQWGCREYVLKYTLQEKCLPGSLCDSYHHLINVRQFLRLYSSQKEMKYLLICSKP